MALQDSKWFVAHRRFRGVKDPSRWQRGRHCLPLSTHWMPSQNPIKVWCWSCCTTGINEIWRPTRTGSTNVYILPVVGNTHSAPVLFHLAGWNIQCIGGEILLDTSRRKCRYSPPFGVEGSARQDWVVDWAPTDLQHRLTNGGVISTPLPIKLLSFASPSLLLD